MEEQKKKNNNKNSKKNNKNSSNKTNQNKKKSSNNNSQTKKKTNNNNVKKTNNNKSNNNNATKVVKKSSNTNNKNSKKKTNSTNKNKKKNYQVKNIQQQKEIINDELVKKIDVEEEKVDFVIDDNIKQDNYKEKLEKKPKKNKNIIKKVLLFFLYICKAVLNFFKRIKKRKKKQYNIDRQRELNNDELILLRYRDYKGLLKILVFFRNRMRVIIFDMRRFRKRFKYGTLKDKLLIIFMLCLIAGFSLVIAFCAYIVTTAPDVSIERLYKSNSTVLYDVNGKEFARIGSEKREKISYDELPEVLIDAIVATEDSRFFQHNGIDIARFVKASIGQLLGHSDAGGGSTLTMQISKNTATSSQSSGLEGIVRKFQDIYLSVFVFEKQYTKEQIMEFYVNIPNLGAYSYGVEQASQTYFGKSVSDLTLVEAATIAGLFQAPTAYNPYAHPVAATNRRNTVLNLMYRHGYITEEERDAAKAVPMESLLVGQDAIVNKYQDFIDTVLVEIQNKTGYNPFTTSMRVYTTMDPKKQDVVNGVISGENYKWVNDKAQAGIAVISVDDGSLVAVGASRDPNQLVNNYATFNNGELVKRHPGSVAKPVLDYGPAIEYLNWSTGNTVIDDNYTYSGGGSIKNYDNKFIGVATAKKALAHSRNIPALYTFQQTTSEQKLSFSKALNWNVLDDGNGNPLETCSIGGWNGVTPLEVSAAYATFARGGTYIEPYSFTRLELIDSDDVFEVTPKRTVVMSEETAYLITMILKYAVSIGKVPVTKVKGTEIAGKTGTSTVDAATKKALKMKNSPVMDSWLVSYSPDYAIAQWYGYETPSKDYYLTSAESTKQRRLISEKLSAGIYEKNSKFNKPKSVVTAEIEIGTDPLELASVDTPDDLRSTEYFKSEDDVPTTTSNRFAKLDNPSGLRYSSTSNSVTLSWNAAPIPDAINKAYLEEYFTNSPVYSYWKDKYLQERLDYNDKTFGSFGYQVYLVNAYGTKDLGFTTSTTFTANVTFDAQTKFVVKSSYQKFKKNQSSGIYITASPNSSTPDAPEVPSTPTNTTFSIQYIGPSCSTLNDFNSLGSKPSDKIKITSNGVNVTSQANISYSCYDEEDNEVSCNNLRDDEVYDILFTIRYNGNIRNKRITITPYC